MLSVHPTVTESSTEQLKLIKTLKATRLQVDLN